MSDLGPIVNALVGRPWERGGFDCWAFVREIYAQAYGVILPTFPGVDGADLRQGAAAAQAAVDAGEWVAVPVPRDGDAVLLGRARRPHHVGVWLVADGGRVAHCDQGAGVCCQTLRQLTASGWSRPQFFRHRSRA